MGAFYRNIALRGPSQSEVADWLRTLRQEAYVSPTVRGITVVYPTWRSPELAAQLSKDFVCPAIFAYVSDSDYLQYYLFDKGNLVDAYISDGEC